MADNDKPKIRITCKGANTVSLSELEPLQGDLKALTEQGYEKLKQSIIRYGISFPLFYWQSNGSKYCIDGHQRERVLRKMAEEGYKIPKNIPACPIAAKDRREACEKILLISSQYGRMDNDTLYAFASENELDLLDLGPMLELPQVDFERFKTGYLEEPKPPDGFKPYDENIETHFQCPKCGYQWSGKSAPADSSQQP